VVIHGHQFLRVAVAAAVILTAGGCTKLNPLYCQENADCASFSCDVDTRECNAVLECTTSATCAAPNAPICDGSQCVPCGTPGLSTECSARDGDTGFCADDGRCVECLDDTACGSISPVCDLSDNTCRGCDDSSECVDLGIGAEICAPTGACVACLTHADCSSTSEVCDRVTSTCADTADVFFVDGDVGTNVGSCGTKASPCLTIEFGLALAGDKPFLFVRAGNYSGNITVNGETITIVGPGVSFVADADAPALTVNNGSVLGIDGMTLRGANGSGNPVGIHCRDAGTTLTLFDVRVTANESHGIDSASCAIIVERGSVDNNNSIGISAFNGDLTIIGSDIHNNDDGGIHLLSAEYNITNTFIVENGGAGAGGSDIGGVRIDNATEMRPQLLAFNTIASNSARPSANSSGVHCDVSGTASPVITSNIVYGNVGGLSQTSGNCTWRYSNIESFPGAGDDNNIDADPLFVNVLERDYHLRSGSPCDDAGEELDGVLFDYDIDIRTGYDIGADELD